MGVADVSEVRQFGHVLATLKEPEAPKGFKELMGMGAWSKPCGTWRPRSCAVRPARRWCGKVLTWIWLACPFSIAGRATWRRLITWGLVITQGPHKARQNLGIYRQQVLARNKVIMRWLPHRGGALDFREHAAQNPGKPYPVCVALGADPATILGAVTPVPDSLSEYQFAGLLRGSRTELVKALGSELRVPAFAEIVLEGHISTPMPPTPAALSMRWKARLATTPATTTSRLVSQCSPSTASRSKMRAHLPLHLHWQTAR
jgi:4-hydroxy-3-polyprenylbenzoate decarboxylase